MRTVSVAFSLFWRLAILYLVGAFGVLLLISLLSGAGMGESFNDLTSSPTYIKAKPTLAFLAFAGMLVLVQSVFRINLLQAIWGNRVALSPQQWQSALRLVVLLLAALSMVNLLVAFSAPTSFWVNYRLLGMPCLIVLGHLIISHRLVR